MLGNHDDRAAFYNVMQTEKPLHPMVEVRHTGIVELPRANLFLLDSLKQGIVAPGDLGERQLHWLADALDSHAEKPALIFAHHNPRLGGAPEHFPGGLEDSNELWKIIAPRNHVKAYLHGHVHDREYSEHEGIHILNTPAVGYVADENVSTTGWTMLRLVSEGAEVTTYTHVAEHAWNGAKVDLSWRN
jgi:3',5'-cyclic AMP phosphodiesterase CpdA